MVSTVFANRGLATMNAAVCWSTVKLRSEIRRTFVLAYFLLLACPAVYALNPSLEVSQYAHTSWKIRDGFPKGQITSIAQTPDGYIWLGTEFGLVRFDGVKSVEWQWPPDQQPPSNFIFSLLATSDGTLWIGTYKGLVSWKDGRLKQYPQLGGRVVFRLVQDHEGAVWATGTGVTGRLCSILSGAVQCYGEDGSLGNGPFSLYEDSKNNLWVGVSEGLWRWKPGPPKFYPLPHETDGIQGLAEDNGTLLVAWNGGIQRFFDGKTEPYSVSETVGKFSGRRMLRDRDSNLWIGTNSQGLIHTHDGKTDLFSPADGLSGRDVYCLFEDREGNIWVSTIDGLDRFRDFVVGTFTQGQGLASSRVVSVLSDRDGSVWIPTREGLNRWRSGDIARLSIRSPESSENPQGFKALSLFQDSQGRIWVSTLTGFGYLENDRLIPVSDVPGGPVTAIAEDSSHVLWVGNEHTALFKLVDVRVVQQIPWATFGGNGHASAMAANPSGGLWLGFHLGSIVYFSDGQIRATYTTADGLASGRVNHLRTDPEGTLWAATDGGLSRLKNGKVVTLTSKNGLPCDSLHWSMEDDDRSLWLYSACGLVRIERADFDAGINAVEKDKDTKQTIKSLVFGLSDGVRSLALGGHFSPQVAKSADGKLWFLPWDGVSVVDPHHLPINQLPPSVHVEQLIANGKTYDAVANQNLRLPALIRDLQIDYTALSLVAPEKVQFRYKLESRDRDWQEVTDRRQAFYNDLPPGNYRFRVIACNNNGVWNETGSYLDFSIAPAYYQTTWFRLALFVAFLLVLGAIYQIRLQQVAGQVRGRMEERLQERERIARDLHDTLLQSVQGLILKFHAVSKQIPSDAPARTALEKTLDHADQVLAEGRDRIRNLRVNPASLSDLPAAFLSVVEETPQGREVIFKTVLEGRVRDLHPLVLEESYCIGREAIINALSHSGAQHVEAEIAYDSRQFRLRVRDDGRGIDPKILEEGGRPGHWGLRGMRERAQKIGGQLKFWSRPETGTEIELTVPAATAYQSSTDKEKKRFSFNRFLNLRLGTQKTDD